MFKKHIVSICAKIVFSQNCRDVKNEVFEKKLHFCFCLVYIAARETENKNILWKNRNEKNGFLANIAWHYLCQEGKKKTRIFVHTICFGQKCFGPKQWEPEKKNYKIVVSAEIAQNPKRHLFLKKVFFDMGEKVGFTNCVFEKLCSSENTIFIVFSAKHGSCNRNCMLKKQKIMKNCGLFLNMAKGMFCLFIFQVLMLLWFAFVRLVKLQKC